MPSARLVAFLEELAPLAEPQQARAEALILRVPGEDQAPMTADAEAAVLEHVGDALGPPVQRWVRAVQTLAEVERGWGPADRARDAARAFHRASEEFLAVWERLLRVQPSTPAMREVLLLVHQGCYELWLSGPSDLLRSCGAIAGGRAEARLEFQPEAPSLREATLLLRRLQARKGPAAPS